MKKFLLLAALLFSGVSIHSQIVNIPDANFKNYLVTNASINTNFDNEIQVSEASAFTGLILCSSLNISDLTGIEAFTNIIAIQCSGNQLTSLDLSSNVDLGSIKCVGSQLTSLNVANGNNSNIQEIEADNNPNLTCIQVDDAAYSNTNWTGSLFSFDAASSFSEDCSGGSVSITEQETMDISVYPNPTSSHIKIDSEEMISGIAIFNMFGELVQQETSTTFSVESLPNGMYVMNIKTSKGIIRSRFIKE